MHDVIVIGAGITGASTAYHLKKLGVDRVLLIERDQPASGGTGRSAAAVRQHYSTTLMARLAKSSIEKFRGMESELGMDGGYVANGYCIMLPPGLAEAGAANVAQMRAIGVDTRLLSAAEIAENMPWADPDGIAAVAFEPDGGYADPVRTTEAYVHGFNRLGGEFVERTPVRRLLREGDRIIGIETDDGLVHAAHVVNAAGPWAEFLTQSVDLDLSIRTVREQDTVWELPEGRAGPPWTISNAVDAIYVRPLGINRYIVGRGFPKAYIDVDPYNYKQTADEEFVSDILERVQRRFPAFMGCRRIDSYAALYDVTPDWYPFIGLRTGIAGYADAAGGSGHGFKIGPAIGEELARWIATGDVADDFKQLSFDRIAEGRPFKGAYGGNRG